MLGVALLGCGGNDSGEVTVSVMITAADGGTVTRQSLSTHTVNKPEWLAPGHLGGAEEWGPTPVLRAYTPITRNPRARAAVA